MESFEKILNSSKESLIHEKIEFDYYNNAKLSLKKGELFQFYKYKKKIHQIQKGGLIDKIIKNNECFIFQIDNVPVSMAMEKLTEWINEYSDILSIKPIDK